MEDLKEEARKRGLFNMFLPRNHFKEGAGFTNVEYGLMAEQLGKSRTASEVCCSATAILYTRNWQVDGGVELDRAGKLLIPTSTGHQLRCTRYRQHGSHRQVRDPGSERQMAQASARRQDSFCVLDDRARHRIVRRSEYRVDHAQRGTVLVPPFDRSKESNTAVTGQ